MSISSNGSVNMLQATRTNRETFHNFFEGWLTEQNQRLQDLISGSESYKQSKINNNNNNDKRESSAALQELINRVIHHYEHYYRTKSQWVKEDALSMLSPSWRTTLEDAFLWIGGWRPSMAFHLLYSKSGIQLEAAILEFIRGLLRSADLGEFSPDRVMQVDEFHIRIVGEEREITEMMAKEQAGIANPTMVAMSHAVSEMMRGGEEGSDHVEVELDLEGRVERVIGEKEKGMEEILQMADDLRMRTLKGVTQILSPIEAVNFLIAAAELHLRMHDWGKKKEAAAARVHRDNQEEEVPVQQNGVQVGS